MILWLFASFTRNVQAVCGSVILVNELVKLPPKTHSRLWEVWISWLHSWYHCPMSYVYIDYLHSFITRSLVSVHVITLKQWNASSLSIVSVVKQSLTDKLLFIHLHMSKQREILFNDWPRVKFYHWLVITVNSQWTNDEELRGHFGRLFSGVSESGFSRLWSKLDIIQRRKWHQTISSSNHHENRWRRVCRHQRLSLPSSFQIPKSLSGILWRVNHWQQLDRHGCSLFWWQN